MTISRQSEAASVRSRIGFWLSLSILTACQLAFAEDFSNFYSQSVLAEAKPVFQKDIESLYKTVREHLSPEENRKLGNPELEFPLRDPLSTSDPFNFYSRAAQKTVIIPVQSKVFLSDMILAWLWLADNGYSSQTVLDYAGMLGYYSRKSAGAFGSKTYFHGQFPLPLAALQIPDDAAQDRQRADNRDQKLTDAMTFAFCHELGHVFYGHPSTSSVSVQQSRANEIQADAFALDLLRRISRAPLGSAYFFMIVAHYSGREAEQLTTTRTHPLSAARLQALAAALEKNADQFARNETNREIWSASARALAAQITLAADGFDGALTAHGVQVANLNAGNIKERLAPRKTVTYEPGLRAGEALPSGKFSGIFNCGVRSVLSGHAEGNIGQGLPPIEIHLILRRKGDHVEGEYTYKVTGVTGRLEGNVENGKLAFKWNEPPNLGYPPREGTGLWESTEDGGSFTGDWERKGDRKSLGKWEATRAYR